MNFLVRIGGNVRLLRETGLGQDVTEKTRSSFGRKIADGKSRSFCG